VDDPAAGAADVRLAWARRPVALLRRAMQRLVLLRHEQPDMQAALHIDVRARRVPGRGPRARRYVPAVLGLRRTAAARELHRRRRMCRVRRAGRAPALGHGGPRRVRSVLRARVRAQHAHARVRALHDKVWVRRAPQRVRDNCTHCEACPPQAREIQLAHAGLLLRLLLGMRAEARARW
jgi:hypothetical protein